MGTIRLINADGKLIGTIDTERRELVKRVVGSKHFLHTPRAIAIDAALYDANRHRFDMIRVEDTESGVVYVAHASHFDTWRIVLDRGYGRQYALLLSKWCVVGRASEQMALFEEEVLR